MKQEPREITDTVEPSVLRTLYRVTRKERVWKSESLFVFNNWRREILVLANLTQIEKLTEYVRRLYYGKILFRERYTMEIFCFANALLYKLLCEHSIVRSEWFVIFYCTYCLRMFYYTNVMLRERSIIRVSCFVNYTRLSINKFYPFYFISFQVLDFI